ncbi:MAG TPA: hypothetical protein VMT69_11720 [Kineosporiaceae bacterium]|nr:hypothetical protein [Kineosporiaceae bacterium]
MTPTTRMRTRVASQTRPNPIMANPSSTLAVARNHLSGVRATVTNLATAIASTC